LQIFLSIDHAKVWLRKKLVGFQVVVLTRPKGDAENEQKQVKNLSKP
jgi:hypothetical protein